MKKIWLFVVLGVILFIPNDVQAEVKVTMCSEGCDYVDFNDLGQNYSGTDSDPDLIIEIGEGTVSGDNFNNIIGNIQLEYHFMNITLRGTSKENSIINDINLIIDNFDNLTIENLTINLDTLYINGTNRFRYEHNVKISNVNFIYDGVTNIRDIQLMDFRDLQNLSFENVVFDNNLTVNFNEWYRGDYYDGIYIGSSNGFDGDVNINNLVINNNSNEMYKRGLILDNVNNASINNLTVNNSEVGLYVHRKVKYNKNSKIEVNNSNLLNNSCSSFNILDDNEMNQGATEMSNILTLNKNYQVVFNENNKLNCAVASGTDTNTYVSGENTWEEEPISYTYDEIDYDNLTNTVQNINNGTVDVVKNYKGTVTIEEGSSVDDDTAFEEELNLDGVIWTSEDESIARIENGKILGLKEGTTTITGVSSDELTTYEIVVNVVKNPVTNSVIYVGIGVILILVLGTALYTVYRIKTIVKED